MAKKSPNFETGVISFDFGEAGACEIDVNTLSDEMRFKLMVHGASQKIGDNYAGAKSATDGTEINPEEWAKGQAEATIKQLVEGEWSTRRAGGGAAVTDLVRALVEVMPDVTEEAAAERLADASKEDKAALRKHPQIKAVLERLRAERASAKAEQAAKAADEETDVDLGAMFA